MSDKLNMASLDDLFRKASELEQPEPKKYVPGTDATWRDRAAYVGARVGLQIDLVSDDIIFSYMFGELCEGHFKKPFDHPGCSSAYDKVSKEELQAELEAWTEEEIEEAYEDAKRKGKVGDEDRSDPS